MKIQKKDDNVFYIDLIDTPYRKFPSINDAGDAPYIILTFNKNVLKIDEQAFVDFINKYDGKQDSDANEVISIYQRHNISILWNLVTENDHLPDVEKFEDVNYSYYQITISDSFNRTVINFDNKKASLFIFETIEKWLNY